MMSFSKGSLCATSKASAVNPLSLIFISLVFLKQCLFFSKNYINKNAPMRLVVSVNE